MKYIQMIIQQKYGDKMKMRFRAETKDVIIFLIFTAFFGLYGLSLAILCLLINLGIAAKKFNLFQLGSNFFGAYIKPVWLRDANIPNIIKTRNGMLIILKKSKKEIRLKMNF